MDFLRYAEGAAALLNAAIVDEDALVAHLADRPWLQSRATDRDCMLLRKLQRELRPVFEAAAAGDEQGAVEGLNELLVLYPLTPQISAHDGGPLHLHAAGRTDAVADLLVGEALLGLAHVFCDLGPSRFGTCAAAPCTRVFVDTSPNASRRYCSERCASRANVAAYRARRRRPPPVDP